MKITFAVLTVIVLFVSTAYAEDCQQPPCEIKYRRPDVAAAVGATAAAGLLSASSGLEAALGSMGIVGGISLLTGAITNSDQRMFIKLQNRAAKAVKKKKTDKPFKNVRIGKYESSYGTCKSSPDGFELAHADGQMASAYFITFDNVTHAGLLLSDGTFTVFDESAKRVMCNGNVKNGSFNKTIIIYCLDSDGRFCNRAYQFTD